MDTTHEDERGLLASMLSRLLAAHYSFADRRRILSSPLGFSRDVWRAFADMGLISAALPETEGGTPAILPVIMAAFGRALVVEPFIATAILAGGLISRAGTRAQKSKYLADIAVGEKIWAVAFGEVGARFNLHNVTLKALPRDDGFVLNGEKAVVYAAPQADMMLVLARTAGEAREAHGLSLFVVSPDAAGLSQRGYATVDGMRASDLVFDGVYVGANQLLGPLHGAAPFIDRAVDEAIAALCAEAAGAIAALNEKVLEHCRTRIVFGKPLASLQVVQHRLVDMHVAQAHAEAAVDRAYACLARPGDCAADISAAKVQVMKEAVLVAKEAVQLHGAMGITDELDVSHYFRRLTMMASLFGSNDFHLRRFIARAPVAMTAREALEQAAEFSDLTPDEISFRDEIRRFYADNLSEDLRRAGAVTLWHMSEFAFGKRWQKILYDHGYGAPEWPVEYGGRDWTARQRRIWAAEQARARPPSLMLMGRIYCAPCIMKFGTEAQKEYFLPRIISGEDWWAQGYSEPGAGSDLAALSLSAESDGDDYILNGSKIWTTFAQHANRIFCLVRTSRQERKQAGITFLLIDMDTPGIEIRPIVNMAGDHDFNEVFFTNVRVPKSRTLGEEDHGWEVARYLLRFEHGANLVRANMENLRRLGWLREIAALESDGEGGRLIDDPDFSRHIGEAAIAALASDHAVQQAVGRIQAGVAPDSQEELLTIRSREIGQRLTELAAEAIGYYGAPVQHGARAATAAAAPVGPAHALLPMPFYLTQRGATIAGGAPEVHRNNLARRLLHL